MTCYIKCPVYLFTRKKISKQCTVEITDRFSVKPNNCKYNDRNFQRGEYCMQEHLYENFYSDRHNVFPVDVTLTLTDKTDGGDPKNKQNYWTITLKQLTPDGINI